MKWKGNFQSLRSRPITQKYEEISEVLIFDGFDCFGGEISKKNKKIKTQNLPGKLSKIIIF